MTSPIGQKMATSGNKRFDLTPVLFGIETGFIIKEQGPDILHQIPELEKQTIPNILFIKT